MPTCPRCGAENKEGRRACWNCWTLLTGEEALPESVAVPDTPAPLPESVAVPDTPVPLPEPISEPPLPPAEPPSSVPEDVMPDEPTVETPPADEPAEDTPLAPAEEPEPAPPEETEPIAAAPPGDTDAIPGPPVDEDGAHAHLPDESPPASNSYAYVVDDAARVSRHGEWWLLGITIALATLVIGAILFWYFSFHPKSRAQASTDVAQAYISALTSGDILSQSQLSTSDSHGKRLPGWLTVSTAALTGGLTTHGDTATAPLTLTVVITPPTTDPANPAIPITKIFTMNLPLAREGRAWRVDQTLFFSDMRKTLDTQNFGVKLPAWE